MVHSYLSLFPTLFSSSVLLIFIRLLSLQLFTDSLRSFLFSLFVVLQHSSFHRSHPLILHPTLIFHNLFLFSPHFAPVSLFPFSQDSRFFSTPPSSSSSIPVSNIAVIPLPPHLLAFPLLLQHMASGLSVGSRWTESRAGRVLDRG